MKKLAVMFSMFAVVVLSGMFMTACAADYPVTVDGVTREGEYIVSVNATATQNRDKACAIAAVYDENNVLIGVTLSNTIPIQKGDVTFPLRSKIKVGGNQTASIFVWSVGANDDITMEPFSEKYTVKAENERIDDKVYDFDKTYEYETKQIDTDNNGANIYGMAYIPKDAGDTVPTVVISHGYGGSNSTNRSYAEYLASHGIAAYCFDFRGGGYGSRSDGETADM